MIYFTNSLIVTYALDVTRAKWVVRWRYTLGRPSVRGADPQMRSVKGIWAGRTELILVEIFACISAIISIGPAWSTT